MKAAFYTLGCKVNQYETQALKEKFISGGYEIVGENEYADVYVINTCTVTGLSDRKSRQYIRRVKRINPKSVTAVIGCFAQVSPQEVKAIPGVNIVAGTNEKSKLLEYVEKFLENQDDQTLLHEEVQSCHIKLCQDLNQYEETGTITSMDSKTRAYIKVQEGCNCFCSYCIIPFARGGVRSRSVEAILTEAENLLKKGFKELVLTGINTALYGTEPTFPKTDLLVTEADGRKREVDGIEIIVNLLNALPGDFRIRLSSLEPTVVNGAYVQKLLTYEKLCPHFHLSLQSGSDRILEAMNRHYNRKQYLEIVSVLRKFDPDFGISTDLIVGFPGETQRDFKDSLDLVSAVDFCKVHAFKYSKRKMTRAADMPNHLSPEVKARRSAELIEAGDLAAKHFFGKNKGKKRRVLFEEFDQRTECYRGHSDNYIEVYSKSEKDLTGTFAWVVLEDVYENGMRGRVCEKDVR